ncbi:protein translocase subunit secF [Desulforamulus reducens MI-1]|uniref:Protein-export membrane protein SecF n=1 Tax=Desulforamulus reducens (strain ATCC BAA-1160 / DSM 100696 / MI-1) TaxID=349161 RepID=A4J545_DESRM|nr:protein translocase subunit SecF [Desulforamulus reducens]ABO50198.1 protein translocase subunit secF [Desulforamulus reducens MI-1]
MFHIIKKRKIYYIISLAIILIGMVSLLTKGLNLGIDFTGGNIVELQFKKSVTAESVRAVLAEYKLADSKVQTSGENTYLIRTHALTQEESDKAFNAISEKLGGATVLRNELVGPVIGKELTRQAILALAIASVLMILYITWRFEFLQGISAIGALLHDVLVMVGMASLLQIEIDSTFVAAVLTIIGYSINDTIVIFDRIRENMRKSRKEDLADLVNKSLWQTMARSINTVLTVVFVLVALLLFGGSTIHNFVSLLLIGVISGAYSSIFNASPVWFDLRRIQKERKASAKATA